MENVTGDTIASLIYLGILVLVLGSIFFAANRPSIRQSLQTLLVWGLIFLGLIAAYGLWEDVEGGFTRDTVAVVQEGSITVPRSRDGHFYLTATINNTPIEFLVDTGATDLVLTQSDAERVGIDVNSLAFLGTANTANGTVPIARTRLDKVQVGDFLDYRVSASVNGGDMRGSLLGMSYLGLYDRIEILQDQLVLHR
ncbi:MAG: TIGR02281 family clan AA aspartic protease [Pseudomonadota bacterium]